MDEWRFNPMLATKAIFLAKQIRDFLIQNKPRYKKQLLPSTSLKGEKGTCTCLHCIVVIELHYLLIK